MLKDLSFTDKAVKYIAPEHLYSDAHKWLFQAIREKYLKNGGVPSAPEIEVQLQGVERHKRRMFRSFIGKVRKQEIEDPDYVKSKLGEFAKRASFSDLFATGQTFYNAGKTAEAYTFVMESINHIYSITFDDDEIIGIGDFEKMRRRFVNQRVLTTDRIPTGIPPLDQILRGGLSRLEGEFGVILAEPKKGKTVALIHMGAICALMKMGRVVHFAAEGATETTTMRYQSRITGIPEERITTDDLSDDEQRLLDRVKVRLKNWLFVVPFNKHWEYTTTDIETKCKELDRRGFTPSLCVIDYADLLQPREKVRDERLNQRSVYRELKRLALMRKMAVWTASQAQRPKDMPSKEGILRGADISETFEKVRIADFLCSLNQTPREKEMGIMRLHADIYRNSPADKTVRLITDFERMIFHKASLGFIEPYDMPEWMRTRSRRAT